MNFLSNRHVAAQLSREGTSYRNGDTKARVGERSLRLVEAVHRRDRSRGAGGEEGSAAGACRAAARRYCLGLVYTAAEVRSAADDDGASHRIQRSSRLALAPN